MHLIAGTSLLVATLALTACRGVTSTPPNGGTGAAAGDGATPGGGAAGAGASGANGGAGSAGAGGAAGSEGGTDAPDGAAGAPTMGVPRDGGPPALCGGDGTLGATSPMCPGVPMLSYDLLAVTGEARPGLPACAGLDASGAGLDATLTILDAASVFDGGQSNFDTTYHAKRTAASGDCGVLLDFTTVGIIPTLAAGDTVRLRSRVVQLPSDMAPTTTTALYDAAGRPLLILGGGVAAPDRISFDLLDGLALAVGADTVCSIRLTGYLTQQIRHVTFTVGAASCDLDGATERCCTLWDGMYLTRVQDAYSVDAQTPLVNFELARAGFWATLSSP
jgi:hypothetical protein